MHREEEEAEEEDDDDDSDDDDDGGGGGDDDDDDGGLPWVQAFVPDPFSTAPEHGSGPRRPKTTKKRNRKSE